MRPRQRTAHTCGSEPAVCSRGKGVCADFLSTFNGTEHHANRKVPAGSLHLVAANHGICDVGELPEFWGLLVPRGAGMVEAQKPTYCETAGTIATVHRVGYELLWKREWRGRMSDQLALLASEYALLHPNAVLDKEQP